MKNKLVQKSKRLLSGIVATAIAASMLPTLPAMAEETTEKYPYTLFAASSEEGAITVNAGNFCVNGNVATNGTILSSGNMNINGTMSENVGEETIYILKKLNYAYFSGDNVDVYPDDYSYEEINININDPMAVQGELELTGNINLNTGIKALEDVNLNGEVKNTNDSVICSETGDIVIDSTNVNLNGLVYAPYGDVEITAQNLNLNNVIIIADTITFNCPSVNANYSISMAELVGTESDVNVELYAFGEYNLEANSIDIKWYTNYSNSSYEIWTSADNTSYTSVATVADSTEYQYAIDEDFDTKYFKISLTTNYNEYIESIPFIVRKKENGYFVDFLDSEDDGLPDVFEISLGTDINDADSDKDGLSDFQEFYITGTEPTIYDSVVAGVPDADADSDNDALSNIQEIELGTNPQLDDSDDDDISDYNELYVYETNPINPDSDNDRLEDGDELHIGLDPTNPETFGTPDAEYKVEQTIPADSGVLSEINIAENAYELSVELKTNGFAEKEVTVSKSSYSYAIENDAMIGLSADICISDTCNPEEIVLKYSIKESYIDNTLNLYSSLEEFQGIKRLNIFKFHEDTNMLLPIETDFDVENGLLYAEVDELGTYCIMDMEIWLNNLGVEMPEESQSEENVLYFNSPSILSDAENSVSVWSPTYENVPIDLIFILQSAGKSSEHFDTEKQLIIDFASSIMREYSDVKTTVVEFKKDNASILTDNFGREYFTNIQTLSTSLNNIEYSYESDYCDRGQAFKILLNDVSLNYEHDIYVYKLINGNTNSYGSYDNENIISKVKNNEVRAYSEIMPYGWHYRDASAQERISKAITDNKDLFITLNSDTLSAMSTHFPTKLSPARPVYEIIVPTKWKKIHLDGEFSSDNFMDTDKDMLTDWEEIKEDELIKLSNGHYTLPKFSLKSLFETLKRYDNDEYLFITGSTLPIYYLPILSDPTEKDSDGDDIVDRFDDYPLWVDPDPFSPSNISSMQYVYIEVEKPNGIIDWIGRYYCERSNVKNQTISIIESKRSTDCMCYLFKNGTSVKESFILTESIKNELLELEYSYQKKVARNQETTIEEAAAHFAKQETDQLIPTYLVEYSNAYYACWAHNYAFECKLYSDYLKAIDIATQAYMVYLSAVAIYQAHLATTGQKSIKISQEEYSTVYREKMLGEGCKLPQGITKEQFSEASNIIRTKTSGIGEDIVVQGSRASGTAKATSDIDIAIRVDSDKFSELIGQRFGTPNPGSAKERTMLHAIETGKIQSGEAGLRGLRLELEEVFGMDVDISIIKIGGPFDNPPFIPFE